MLLTFPRAGFCSSPLPSWERHAENQAPSVRPRGTQATLGQKEAEGAELCPQTAASGRPEGGLHAPRSQQFLVLLGLGPPRGQDLPRRLQQDFALWGKGAPLPHNPGGPPTRIAIRAAGGPSPARIRDAPVTAARRWGRGSRAHLARLCSKLYRPSGGDGRPKVARPDPAPR